MKMRDFLKAPHSTERCKISNNFSIYQVFIEIFDKNRCFYMISTTFSPLFLLSDVIFYYIRQDWKVRVSPLSESCPCSVRSR